MSPLLPLSARQSVDACSLRSLGAATSALLRSRDLKIEGYPELRQSLG